MATDNTSDISENDIIVAFELKNNSNPLAIYLEYQSKFLFWPSRPSGNPSYWGTVCAVQMLEHWSELERRALELNYLCLALNFQSRIKTAFEITKTKLYLPYSMGHTV